MLRQYGCELYKQNTMRKIYEQLNEYRLKRRNINQLKEISNELVSIRHTQLIHRILVTWYDKTIESV